MKVYIVRINNLLGTYAIGGVYKKKKKAEKAKVKLKKNSKNPFIGYSIEGWEIME